MTIRRKSSRSNASPAVVACAQTPAGIVGADCRIVVRRSIGICRVVGIGRVGRVVGVAVVYRISVAVAVSVAAIIIRPRERAGDEGAGGEPADEGAAAPSP